MKKIVSLALSLLLCVTSVPIQMTSFAVEENFDDFAGGNGTKENPYKVANTYHLRRLAELVNNAETADDYNSCYYVQAPRLYAVVVFATPPFWLAHEMTIDIKHLPFCFWGLLSFNTVIITYHDIIVKYNFRDLFQKFEVREICHKFNILLGARYTK